MLESRPRYHGVKNCEAQPSERYCSSSITTLEYEREEVINFGFVGYRFFHFLITTTLVVLLGVCHSRAPFFMHSSCKELVISLCDIDTHLLHQNLHYWVRT